MKRALVYLSALVFLFQLTVVVGGVFEARLGSETAEARGGGGGGGRGGGGRGGGRGRRGGRGGRGGAGEIHVRDLSREAFNVLIRERSGPELG